MNISGQQYGREMARCRRAGPWELDDIRDYLDEREQGDPKLSSCDLCGTSIRYIHSVSNANLNERIEVGCCCAVRLCHSKEPRLREEEFKSRQAKRATVLRQRQAFFEGFPDGWIQTYKGNLRRTVKGQNVVLFRSQFGKDKGKFCIAIDGEFGKGYLTGDECLEETALLLYPDP